MVSPTEAYAILLLLTAFPTAYLGSRVWDRRDRPTGRWFILTLAGMGGWAICWALVVLFDGYAFSIGAFNLVLLFVNVTAVGWLFVAIEFARQRRVTARETLAVAVVPVLTQLLAWSSPLHGLIWRAGTSVDARGVVHPVFGPWFFVHTGYSYLLILASVALLVGVIIDKEGLYRTQALILLLGSIVPVVTPTLFVLGVIPTDYLNPTPVAFLVGAGIWGWGLYRYRLLRTVPIARRTALDEMDEGILVIDESGVITTVNPAAREMLGLTGSSTGGWIGEALAQHPDLLELVRQGEVGDEQTTISRAGERRVLTVNSTSITQDGGRIGEVFVFKDQTELLQYEEDLELLKEVLARVLRHDIRNDLNVIRAHGELLAQQTDDASAEMARKVVRTSDAIIETAEKAQAIKSLVRADRQLYDVDLVAAVADAVDWADDQFPDAVIERETPAEAWVRADDHLEVAIRSLVENAVVHNDSDPPVVRVSVRRLDDTVTLEVTDNGPGIPPQERRIFEDRSIDQLQHSSGLGLWLVSWVVRNSNATLDITGTDSGTRITVELNPALSPAPDRPSETGPTGSPT